MARWDKRRRRPIGIDGSDTKPGYQIFVANGGDVRFDFPRDWLVRPTPDGTFRFHDKEPPDDDARLQMTLFRLRPRVDWGRIDLVELLWEAAAKRTVAVREEGEITPVRRPGLDLAWTWCRFPDTASGREIIGNTAFARGKDIQALFTFEYWVECHPEMSPVWDELLRTLALGQKIAGRTVGDDRHKRN